MANKSTSPTKVIIPCRISFANIWLAKSINGGEEKYSVACLIPKSDKATLTKITKAIETAKEDAKAKKWGGKIPPNLKLPLRDGDIDRPDDENYAGHMFLNASSKDAPQIVDRRVQPILDPMECGSGDYCNVSVNFYGFAASGNRGVAAGLGNIQKVKDGERLAGKASASSDFDEIEGEDDGTDLVRFVYQTCGWGKKLTYRIPGARLSDESRLVCFDLRRAYEIHEGRIKEAE